MAGKKQLERDDNIELGGIPTGLILRYTLRGHDGWIGRIAWSPDGRTLASPSADGRILLWDAETGIVHTTFVEWHTDWAYSSDWVFSVAWSPDGQMLASGYRDHTIRLWDIGKRGLSKTYKTFGSVYSVAWSPDGETLAFGSSDSSIGLQHIKTGKVRTLKAQVASVNSVAWSPDGRTLASGSADKTICLWDIQAEIVLHTLEGHTDHVLSVVWSPDGRTLASGSSDHTIRLWDSGSGRQTHILEGHTKEVTCVSFSSNGWLLASKSNDETTRLWDCKTWETLAFLNEPVHGYWPPTVAFHPSLPVLATLGENDTIIRIWDLDLDDLVQAAAAVPAVHHITAKIVLVGDSGVGKTGLGWRLAYDEFKEHSSTHGQQFWTLDSLRHRRRDGTECEPVLWDLAGQQDYRLIHALFLDDARLALVLFNPVDRQDPLHGVEYWLKALSRCQGGPCHTILVGARTDRGDSSLTQAEIDNFCRTQGITGGYVGTSALSGQGMDELIARIKDQIVWDDMAATVTTARFKRIKEFVLGLKQDAARTEVLTEPAALRARLHVTDPSWEFSDADMMTAVGHLANYGYARVLRTAAGAQAILLAPDLLNNLAASFVLEARRNLKGLGALEEACVLNGEYAFPELAGLSTREQEILLDAATVLFLEHNVCFRESLGSQTFFIFPELINRKKPLTYEVETVDDVSYTVIGQVENVYAALVVLLGYTSVFTRTDQWQNHAQYEMGPSEVCAFHQLAEREGEIEFVLAYGPKVGQPTRLLFQGLFEKILSGRKVSVTRYPPLVCPKCGDRQERAVVVKRTLDMQVFLFCSNCGERILLPKAGEVVSLSPEVRERVEQERATADLRTKFEAALVSVKSLARERPPPNCFVSYAWGFLAHESWVEKRLWTDLKNAGVDAILDRRANSIGADLARFISRIASSQWIIVVGTSLYLQKYENRLSPTGSVVAAEVNLIHLRCSGTNEEAATVLPVLLDGEDRTSFPPLLRGKVYADFRREQAYFASLFDLILTLYGIPFDNPAVADLRETLCLAAG